VEKLENIFEQELINIRNDSNILELLLKDNTSKHNLIWATDLYRKKGFAYYFNNEIYPENIYTKKGCLIKPRANKSKREQNIRIKERAEVFTPSWLCNRQNNLIDEAWLDKKFPFNYEVSGNKWESSKEKVKFENKGTWEDYVSANRLEVACGEAPYIVSRYDSVTGVYIEPMNRIGILDRKLRVICENTIDKAEWEKYAEIAYKSVYGYDWQGDNVFLARINMLFTFSDYYEYKFKIKPSGPTLKKIATILSWNIWQMDGTKLVVPKSCKREKLIQITLFGDEVTYKKCAGCKENSIYKHNGLYCKIMNWEINKPVKFLSIVKKGK